jgi:hypothetical protein
MRRLLLAVVSTAIVAACGSGPSTGTLFPATNTLGVQSSISASRAGELTLTPQAASPAPTAPGTTANASTATSRQSFGMSNGQVSTLLSVTISIPAGPQHSALWTGQVTFSCGCYDVETWLAQVAIDGTVSGSPPSATLGSNRGSSTSPLWYVTVPVSGLSTLSPGQHRVDLQATVRRYNPNNSNDSNTPTAEARTLTVVDLGTTP